MGMAPKATQAARRFLLAFLLTIFALQLFAIFLSIQISRTIRNVHLPRLIPEDIELISKAKSYIM